MHRLSTLGSAIACAVALAGSASAAPQAATDKTGASGSASASTAPQATKAKAGGAMTLTGCLEAGSEANTFKLTHVADEAGAGTKTAEAMKPDWELIGAPASLKMSDHVGHKVTVTGTHASAAAAAKMEGQTGSGSKAKESMERHLKVTSLKHVAPTCP
jgi:hypothetical protein